MNIGAKVIITDSKHADISIGQEGVIDCVHDQGFGVAIQKRWHFVNAVKEETRVVWFASGHIKEI